MSFCLMSEFVLTLGSSEAKEAAQRVRKLLQEAVERGWLNWLDPDSKVTYRLPRMDLSVTDYWGLINAGHKLPKWEVLLVEQRLAIELETESSDPDAPGRGRGSAAPPPVKATPPSGPPSFKAPPAGCDREGRQAPFAISSQGNASKWAA